MDLDGVLYCAYCMRQIDKEKTCPYCGFDNSRIHNISPALECYTLLNNRYQIGSVVGSGGFGITYAAWDEKLWIPVAVKEYFPVESALRDSGETDEVTVAQNAQKIYLLGKDRFLRESRVLAMLQDIPGIVKVYDSFEENNTAYIVMEYVHGMVLDQYVKIHHTMPEQVLQMVRQTVDALVAVHRQGILHRDITPSNLLAQEDGSVKLIDFGSAAQIGQKHGTIVLTQHYAPVEQYDQNYGHLGPWTDVYGLSATLYDLLTGEVPQESIARLKHDEMSSGNKKISLRKSQRKALLNGLIIQPDKRIQSMEEFRARLYHLPMPEEVRQRKRFMHRIEAAGAVFAVFFLLLLINFTCGLPLGQGLLYSLRRDGFHIVSEIVCQEERELPEMRLGIPVTAVEENAFLENHTLRILKIPAGIRQVGNMAFYRCSMLEQIIMEEGVQKLGSFAFAGCESLNTVYVPESLTYFSADTFEGVSPWITVWGSRGCTAEQILQEQGFNFAVRADYEIETNGDDTVLTVCRDSSVSLVLPSVIDGQWVTKLSGDLAISDKIEEIEIPKCITKVETGIFSDRKDLKKVTLGSDTRILGKDAFKGSAIEQLIIPEYLEEIGEEALMGTYLRELILPDGLKYIGKRAFSQSFLRNIILPTGVERIEEQAFSSCVRIEEVHLPEGIDEIGEGLFENCIRLKTVYIPSTAKAIRMYAFRGCRAMETMLIPENIEEIDVYAFAECTGLQYVAMPQKLERVNLYIFDGCPNDMVLAGNGEHAAMKFADLKNYIFEDESIWNERIVVGSKGTNTFALGNIEAEKVVLPSYNRSTQTVIEKVWPVAEETNNTIREIILPRYGSSVETIAFINLTELETVTIPDTLETIGQMAFGGCINLKEVNLPENIRLIDDGAFMNCRSLTSLNLPDSIYHISAGAFFGCVDIKQIRIPEGMSLLADGVFGRTGIEHIVVPENISKVRCAFFECDKLISVDIQRGVRSLWESFAGCSALETVTIPDSLEIISQNTFAGCTELKEVTFYADQFEINEKPYVTSIKTYAENADGTLNINEMQSIELPNGGAALDNLFADCPSVTIRAHSGSKMEQYAKTYGLNFEILD